MARHAISATIVTYDLEVSRPKLVRSFVRSRVRACGFYTRYESQSTFGKRQQKMRTILSPQNNVAMCVCVCIAISNTFRSVIELATSISFDRKKNEFELSSARTTQSEIRAPTRFNATSSFSLCVTFFSPFLSQVSQSTSRRHRLWVNDETYTHILHIPHTQHHTRTSRKGNSPRT